MTLQRPSLILFALVLMSQFASAQEFCATNRLHYQILQQHPELQLKIQQGNQEYVSAMANPQAKSAALYTIPVVFHIIHNNGSENISDALVLQGLDDLNDAFENIGYYDQGTGVDVEIDFCLAVRDPQNNPTTGINRVVSNLTYLNSDFDDIAMKNLSRWDPYSYLNIWLVNQICNSDGCSVAGYAYYPYSHGGQEDGIVCEAKYIGTSSGNSAILAHEIGHYLGLAHTFDGGCPNDDCLVDGDQVCDTPPDGSTAAVPCGFSANTCDTDTDSGFATDQDDMFWNYMDYGDWDCYSAFTEGQKDRMHFFLTGIRASLLDSKGCLTLCPNPYTVEFTTNATTIDIGTTLNFNNTSTNGATGYEWLIDGVPFSTNTNANYTFNTLGIHTIELVGSNGDPLCIEEFEIEIEVICPIIADFSASNPYPIPGEVMTFSNASTGTATYNWTANGIPFSNAQNPTYTFTENGPYQVCLEATNGLCSDTHCQYIWVFLEGEDCGNTYLRTIGSDIDDEAKAIIQVQGGGFILGGGKGDSTLITRIDADGNEVWSRTMKAVGNDENLADLILDSDGNLIGAGWSNSSAAGKRNYVFKYDYINNNLIWFHLLTNPNASLFTGLLEKSPNGNYFLIGQTEANSSPGHGCDALLLELDRDTGNKVAQYNYKLHNCETFHEGTIYDNHIYLTGRYNNPNGGKDKMRVSLSKIDFSGNEIWSRISLVNTAEEARLYGWDIVVEDNAAFVLSEGDLNGISRENITFHLHKTDLDGNIQWAKIYDIPGATNEYPNVLKSVNDGFLILGSHNSSGNVSAYLLKVNKQGEIQWSRSYNFSGEDRGHDLFTKNGGIYMVGEATRQGGSQDILIGKLTLEGETRDPCALVEDLNITETDLANPFNGAVDLIDFELNVSLQGGSRAIIHTELVTDDICVDPCEEICDNGIDDDYNGFTDCEDEVCICTEFCLPEVPVLDLGPDVVICENGIHTFDAGAGHDSYLWRGGSSEQTFTAYAEGTYWVTVMDSCDIIQSDTVNITIEPISEINFDDVTLCLGQDITLTVNEFFDTFTWVPEDGLSCDDCASVTIQPDETTEYRVIGTSDLGCITVDTFEVKINSCGIEICDNGIDDDNDGLIDCYDPDCCNDAICNDFYYDDCPVDCEFTPANTSFQMEEEWRYDAGNWHSYNTAITGDVDGDGVPEVIGKIGPFGNSNTDHKSILVINGQNGNLEATISTPTLKWAMDAVAIADINKNGYAEIIVIASNDDSNGANKGHIYCYEFDGAQYQELWVSDIAIDATLEILCWTPNIADFDGDGNAEVYVSHQIFNGLTGEFLISGGNNNRGVLNNSDIVAQTVAADVLPDNFCSNCSGLELVAGNQVYSIDDANSVMNVEVQATGSDDGFVGIADMDRDGDLDAVITFGTTPTTANVYIWDIQTPNQIGTTHSFPSSSNSEGAVVAQPNIADINNDGNLDIGISGKYVYKFLTLNNGTLDEMWSFSTSDESGRTGSTIFDFEGDGDKEIAYRDESQLRIFDANGATIFSSSCTSGTAFEYPVIVDVDADGETELLCSCGNELVAYGSANTPWIPTRPVWNQHAYFNVNINDDLTIPPIQQQHHIVGDSMVLNNFLTQYSDLEFPVADATISIGNANCDADELEVSITICNIGDNTLSFETPVTFYDNNPTQTSANPLTTLIIGQNIEPDSCLTQIYIIPPLYNQDIYVIVNDDASLNPVFSLENDFPVTAIAECDFTNNIDNFIVPLTTPMLDLGADTTACDAINYTLNAGGDFVTYEWQDGSTDSTFTVTDAGVYSVSVTDICGNIQTDNINVIIENCCELAITANLFNIDCANESGSITTMITNGQMPYIYAWNNGADTPDISNLDVGTYTVTVTDNAGCTATATAEITGTLFQLNISTSNDTLCIGESTNLTASGAQYYEWTPTDGLNNPNIPNPTATPNMTTTYTVNGYTRTENLITNGDFEQGDTGFTSEYNHNPNPPTGFLPEGDYAITNSPTNVHQNFFDCDDHTTSTGNMMVVNGDTIINQSLWCQSVNVQPDTDYDFSTWVATVFPDAPAILQFSINGDLLGTPFTASNTACTWTEFNEIWNSGNNTTAAICIVNQNIITIGNDFALDDITFSTLCTATDSVTIYVSDTEVTITDIDLISCDDPPCTGSATASVMGGFIENDYTYEWSNGQSTATASDLCAGNYNLRVTDDANCSAVATVEITQEEAFTLAANVLTQITCPGLCSGSASVTVTGGTMPFMYAWDNGASTADISGLCEGIYTLTVTDANDCQDTTSVQINTLSTLMLSGLSSTPVSCFEGNDGAATASATGGTTPYTYAWSTGATTETIDSLSAGIYTLVITDASGCSLPPVNVTVTEPATSVSVTASANDPTCNGLSNGTATALPEGGTASYDYLWSDGSTTQTAFNLSEGTYSVTVTDANGCTATATTSLSEPTGITTDISTENLICFGDNSGSILIENVSGGLAPYTYSLDGEIYQTENSFPGLAAGTYAVYVQDTEGCVNTFDAVITQPVELLVDLGVDVTVELSDSTQLFAQSNSTDTLTYEWTPANGLSCLDCPNPSVYILDTETYSVTITDSDGCMASDDITVNIDKNRNIFIPNIFSPDNDGTNDLFMIYGGKGVVGILELQIYDRWGNLIFVQNNFQPDDPAMAWDGTFRGRTMNPQVFVYYAEVEFIDGVTIPYKGDITLVK